MKNFWLECKPKIYQQLNPYGNFFGYWTVCKQIVNICLYLHKDSTWHSTTYNVEMNKYNGYFHTREEAEETLREYRNVVPK